MSTQVIDVKSKKPRATKKVTTVVDTIPPSVAVPSETVPSETVPSDTKPKKPRATKKVNDENASPSATVPSATVPSATVPSATVPSATVPSEAVPSEAKPKKPRASKKENDDNVSPSDVDVEDKPKKPRTPTLPAKFAKFIKFNFFFINQLSDIDQETKDAYLKTFAVFDPVDQQTQIVTDYLLSQKTVNKQYRDALSARKKAAAKANKPVRRSKKNAQVDFQNDLVNQLIAAASDNNSSSDKKPRGQKSSSESSEKKPRGRKPKASTSLTNQNNALDTALDQADEEDTQVTRFLHDGKSFLRDSENNLYDELSHEPVGSFDPIHNSISLF
jgi:hypothetical protein